MSSLLHPTGSEPTSVYWRRRILVMSVVLVLVIGLVWLVWPKGSSQTESAPIQPTDSAVGSSASVAPVDSAAPTAAGSAASASAAPGQCATAQLQVTLSGYEKLAAGATQPFKTSITNASSGSCILAVSATNFSLTVTSGSDRIWSTGDCAKWVPSKTVTLKPQASTELDITWPGTRSKATCGTTKGALGAGTYVAKATLTGAQPGSLVMQITKAA
jgi:hypothetical protein